METQWEMKKAELLKHIENTDVSDVPHVLFSGNYIPTLENFPASNWRRKRCLENHIGDIFVKYPKYVYRFSQKEDGSFFWRQIWQQDNLDRFILAMTEKRKKRHPGGWK